MSRRVVVSTRELSWQPSPAPGVWRKRLHRVGDRESGQVTSLVRFDAGASFPEHGHPAGEEILVLEGTFSDDRGDRGAGWYVLNPDGSRHRPFSKQGCVLFVKLQQYGGEGRRCIEIDTAALPWRKSAAMGVEEKLLYSEPPFPDQTRLERWTPEDPLRRREWPDGVEILVLEGDFFDEQGVYEEGSWLRLPAGTIHSARSKAGCTLYVKEGAVPHLRSTS